MKNKPEAISLERKASGFLLALKLTGDGCSVS